MRDHFFRLKLYQIMRFIYVFVVFSFLAVSSCSNVKPISKTAALPETTKLPLDKLKLPKGFKISIYAEDVTTAREMALSPNGTLFVGTRDKGSVYALVDTDKDFKADKMYEIAKGLNLPTGVAFKNGDLYVAEVSRILKYENIESQLANPPQPKVVFDKYPTDKHHGWKFIAFGPDGKLYVPVGAPCNICESKDDIYNSITRLNADGTGMEIVQRGIRNTVGFTWNPKTKDLWFTDNGRDMLGDDLPACELNCATKDYMHFGYPYCHQGDFPDPEFGSKHPCSDYTAPAQKLGAHVAPLGIEFYTGKQFPAEYRDNLAIFAEHGSWNRSKKSGYRVMMVKTDGNKALSYTPFIEGWLDVAADLAWGRPVDIELMPDGSMLISDDFANVIYRVVYQG
jgi:glucose/arabinose dehydrogenase